MTTYEPHAETCSCALCIMARDPRPTYADIWAGDPDTDKYWSREQ